MPTLKLVLVFAGVFQLLTAQFLLKSSVKTERYLLSFLAETGKPVYRLFGFS